MCTFSLLRLDDLWVERRWGVRQWTYNMSFFLHTDPITLQISEGLSESARERRAESLNDRLRSEILNDRHTLLMLPSIRKWVSEMSLRDQTKSITNSVEYSLSVGDNEQFFPVLSDHMNIAHYRGDDIVRVLGRMIKKVEKYGKLRKVLASIMSKTGTQVSVNHELEFLEGFLVLFPNSVPSELESAFNITVVSAVILLYFVYRYLMGSVDRGGPKTYSSGSLDFRDIYVSIVLFRGAYVWIKFRQPARSGCLKRKSCETQDVHGRDESDLEGVYVRTVKDKSGTTTHYKYEPRFKPPRERVDSGTTLPFDCLSLGRYNTPGDAKIVRQVAAFYYEKNEGRVALEDGSYFSIPPMTEQEKCLTGMDKAKWVTVKAKEVHEMLKQLRRATMSGAHSGHGSAGSEPGSSSAVAATCASPASDNSADKLAIYSDIPSVALVQRAPSHGGNGEDQRAAPISQSSMADPIPATEQLSDFFSGNFYGVEYNVSEMQNGAPTTNDYGKVAGHGDVLSRSFSGFEDMIDELLYPGKPDFASNQSNVLDIQMHHLGVTEILGDPHPQQFDGTTQGFGTFEPQLSPNLSIQQGWDFVAIGSVPECFITSGSSFVPEQRDLVHGQVSYLQLLVNRQKKQLEDSAVRNVQLQHQLCESEIQRSALQQENERLRTMLQQVAVSQVATGSGIKFDIEQEEVGEFLARNTDQANCGQSE